MPLPSSRKSRLSMVYKNHVYQVTYTPPRGHYFPRHHPTQTIRTISRRIVQTAKRRARIPVHTHGRQQPARPLPEPDDLLALSLKLQKPAMPEVRLTDLVTLEPKLAPFTMSQISEGFLWGLPRMTGVNQYLRAGAPKVTLPKLLAIPCSDTVLAQCPTHFLAIYSPSPHTSFPGLDSTYRLARGRRVLIYPTDVLMLTRYCARLPSIPARDTQVLGPIRDSHGRSLARLQLPVIPLCVPDPDSFSVIATFFSIPDTEFALYGMIPLDFAPNNDGPEEALTDHTTSVVNKLKGLDIVLLYHHATITLGVYQNACALGISDKRLWSAILSAWELLISAIRTIVLQRGWETCTC